MQFLNNGNRTVGRNGIRANINDILAQIVPTIEADKLLQLETKPSLRYGFQRRMSNFTELFQDDMMSHKGFPLDVSIDYITIVDESKLRNSDSIFSNKFGQHSKDNILYTCKCGDTEEEVAGIVCPRCQTPTDKRTYDRGWFILESFKVFNPDYFNILMSNISSKCGISKRHIEENIFDSSGKTKFNILELQKIEVLTEFIKTYVKEESREYLLNNIGCALSNYIPVLSSKYRFINIRNRFNGKKDVKSHRYNSRYMTMSSLVYQLNNLSDEASVTTRAMLLSQLNQQFRELFNLIIDDLGKDKKKSYLRGKVVGLYKPASCKGVIEGAVIGIDESIISYDLFGVMSMHWYKDIYESLGLSTEGFTRIRRGNPSKGDKIIIAKVLEELKRRHLNVMVSLRAPVIYETSICATKIVGLCNDRVVKFNEIMIGPNFRGDKDGDTSINYLPDPKIAMNLFYALHPSRGVYNPVTGEINGGYELPESIYFMAYDMLRDGEGRVPTPNGDAPNLVLNHNKVRNLDRFKFRN
ncbi:MAG: hypothetical protein ACRC92_27165 [Peptostreptococcaceae bacterium]